MCEVALKASATDATGDRSERELIDAAPVELFTVKSAAGICMLQLWVSVPLR